MATSPLASGKEKTNGAKLRRLLIDGGTTVLRNVFNFYHPPALLATNLNASYSTLNNLLSQRVLNSQQWNKLFPRRGFAPDSNTFDISLLFVLLTNICRLSPPCTGWYRKPDPRDTSREANLVRIKFFRNELHGHVTTTGVDSPSFSTLWQEISAVLMALGLHQSEIDRLRAERCGEDDYLDVLLKWTDSEKDIKTQLIDMRQTQTKTQQTVQTSHETLQENKSKLEEVQQAVTEIRQAQLNADQGLIQTQTKTQQTVQKSHETLKKNKSKLDMVQQAVTEIRQAQLNADQGLIQTQTKTQQTVQTSHETLQENKSKLEEVQQAVTEIRQAQLNADQGLIQTQTKTQQTVQKSHETLQENKSKLEKVLQIGKNMQQVVTEICRAQLDSDQGLSETQTKTQQTVQDIKSKLEVVQQVVSEIRQSQLNTDQGRIQTQTKTQLSVQESHETLQENKSKLEDLHQVVTEIRQSQLNTDQEVEILKKLAKVDTQNNIKYYSERYLEGTRESIFAKVPNWLDDRSSPNRVMIISGNAGMGKSVIAAEMCKRMQENGKLSGSHFCQHDKARRRNPKVMLQSLACHLSCSLPEYKNALVEQLSRNLGLEINDLEVGDLFELLFEEPLRRLSDPGFTSLLVIDALDETEYQGRNELVDVIGKYFNKLPLWIRFLVTTRPEINISDSLKSLQPLMLESDDEENLKDIRFFFEQQLSHLLHDKDHELILKELVKMSEGVMLCAQFLVDFIKKNGSILTLEHLESTVPSGISSVYQSYFKRVENELGKELKTTEDQFFSFLNAITAAREPLPLDFVSKLLFSGTSSSAAQRKVNKAIACISSLLPVQDDCIHFFHKSVKDWLVDKTRYGQHNYSVDESEGHRILSRLCMYEFDELKRKGVDSSEQFSDTTKYALQHGVQHMLELDEGTKFNSLEEVINKYVLDIELVYAKLCVSNAIASEDILFAMKKDGLKGLKALGSMLFLLRKHSRTLKILPRVIFQTLLNEGGPELSSKASNLLETKYTDIQFMEYLEKDDLQGAVQTTFDCSSQVACFDVSPLSDYMVCECRDGTIQLWSLHTGNLMWKRPGVKEKRYSLSDSAFRTPLNYNVLDWSPPLLSCFRSVVFHPIKNAILPGVLSHAYNFNGDLKRLFPDCKCVFSVCSISGDTILTDCPGNAKRLILWSLKNGTEITRIIRAEDVLSFTRSLDGKLLAISHSTGSVCLLDVMNSFQTLAETGTSNVCGIIKFSPDRRFLFCWHFLERGSFQHLFRVSVNVENHDNFSLDVSSDCFSYNPWEFESCSGSGFTLGDPFWCILGGSGAHLPGDPEAESFAFVVNKQSVLVSNPKSSCIKMLSLHELTKDSDDRKAIVDNLAFSVNGETLYVVDLEVEVGVDLDLDLEVEKAQVTAWNVSSGELKAQNTICGEIFIDRCFVPVKEGVLLTKTINGTPELWNFELTECVRCWTDIEHITKMISVSDQRVVCVKRNLKEVIILDTISGDKVTVTGRNRYGHRGIFVACSSKCQLITRSILGRPHLSSVHSVLWDKEWSSTKMGFAPSSLSGMFSPTEQFIVISEAFRVGGVYVLDAGSGNTLHNLCAAEKVHDCKFVSDEECVVSTYDEASRYRLQLFNVRSGHLLSVIDMANSGCRLASCPGKDLIAIGLKKSNFKLIRVKLNKDNQKSNRCRFKRIKLQK